MNEEITEQKFSDSYDTIVIGAGNGGLAATAQLAKNGVKVLLVEQHNLPGGFATSFVRGRFEFETSLHQIDSYGPEPKGGIRRMFEDKFNIEAEFVKVPEAYRLIIDDPEEKLDVTVPFGIDNFINTIEKVAPGSRDGLVKFFKIAEEIKGAFGYFAKSQGRPDQGVLIKDFTNFLKTAGYSVDEVEDALNIPEKARLILNAYWAYMGVPTSRLDFSIFALLMLSYMNNHGYIPKKRSHEFTTALDVKIREFGGKIQYN
ncbi:MAG: phytoene desaturase family protein, partial [Promethearchaeota archaeon]